MGANQIDERPEHNSSFSSVLCCDSSRQVAVFISSKTRRNYPVVPLYVAFSSIFLERWPVSRPRTDGWPVLQPSASQMRVVGKVDAKPAVGFLLANARNCDQPHHTCRRRRGGGETHEIRSSTPHHSNIFWVGLGDHMDTGIASRNRKDVWFN